MSKRAAVHVEIDERERAPIGKARAVQRQQQVAVLRVGVVVPAEPVVAERERRDRGDDEQHADGHNVRDLDRIGVVPAKAGTHTPCQSGQSLWVPPVCRND